MLYKQAKIFGGQTMPPLSGFETREPEAYLPYYHKFLMQKASEPKTSYLYSTVLPAILGAAIGGLVAKNNRPAGALYGSMIAGGTGTIFKFVDDSSIDRARLVQSLQKNYTDPAVAELEKQMILNDRNLSMNVFKKVFSKGADNATTK